jgi:hypothetical protein
MEAICSSETPVDFQRTTRRYIPADRTLRDNNDHSLRGIGEISLTGTLFQSRARCLLLSFLAQYRTFHHSEPQRSSPYKPTQVMELTGHSLIRPYIYIPACVHWCVCVCSRRLWQSVIFFCLSFPWTLLWILRDHDQTYSARAIYIHLRFVAWQSLNS